MKRMLTAILALTLALAPLAAQAQTPGRESKPIRVLLTYGGHAFDEKAFFAMWDSFKGIQYDKAPLPEKTDMLKPGLEKQYDVIVMYDMFKAFTPEQQKNFQALLQTGIGVVSWHHNIAAHDAWPEFQKIIGGKYLTRPATIDGKECPASTYHHDQDMKIAVADANHPITRGIKPFTIHDETYGGLYVDPAAHVLLTTDHPQNSPQVAWTTRWGKSPVLYYQLGHDAAAYNNPSFRRLLVRGIRWASRTAKAAGKAPAQP